MNCLKNADEKLWTVLSHCMEKDVDAVTFLFALCENGQCACWLFSQVVWWLAVAVEALRHVVRTHWSRNAWQIEQNHVDNELEWPFRVRGNQDASKSGAVPAKLRFASRGAIVNTALITTPVQNPC